MGQRVVFKRQEYLHEDWNWTSLDKNLILLGPSNRV